MNHFRAKNIVCAMFSFSFMTASFLTASGQDAISPSQVDISINPANVVQKIDEKIYSHFLEHIYNSCNGGLWGELVWNRSLEAGNDSGWSYSDGILKQSTRATDRRLLLGTENQDSASWTDYDVRVLARKISGSEGFLILFRAAPDMSSYYWLNLGGWQNRYVAFEKETPHSNGRHVVGGQKEIPPIKEGEVYDIRIVVTGQNIKAFVNQELVHEIADFDENAPKAGGVGVGSWGTEVEYGEVLVRDLRRQTLYDLHQSQLKIQNSVNVRYWSVEGNAEYRKGDARNSNKYLRFAGEGALSQDNYVFKEGETYDYSFWTRGAGTAKFSIRNGNNDSEKIASFPVKHGDWIKMSGEFKAKSSSDASSIRLEFVSDPDQTLDVDQISIFPRSWKENYGGFRPDLLKAIADIHPTLIRWPGGCYASAYRWKSGIGPQDDRVAYPLELWNDVDVNSFGIDEFIPFCRRVGAEPLMVVDVGTTQWINAVGDQKLRAVDWLQEVCDWVEYCNGSAETRWGVVRAKNGHPEPYGVKYWEIDNEVRSSDTPAEVYNMIVNELVPRMKAIDPSIKIIACGSWSGDKMKWDADILGGSAQNIDYLSLHRYDDPRTYAFNPYDNQRFFENHREMIANSANPNIKLFSSEWNAQSTDWRTGLYAGGYLNCCERVADVLEIASPALFLRHKTATAWDNAFVNFDNASWYPAPNYVVMKLWRDSFEPNLLELKSEAPEASGDAPLLNVVATSDDEKRVIRIKGVNNAEKELELRIVLDGIDLTKSEAKASALYVSPDLAPGEEVKAKLNKRNNFDRPDAISPRPLDAAIVDGRVVTKAPSLSAFVITINL